MPIASFGSDDALIVIIQLFFLIIWIWILIFILTDLFRDHELSAGRRPPGSCSSWPFRC